LLIGRQLGYGFGTARYKSDANAPADKELVKIGVMAIKAGFYHLDGAQGLQCTNFTAIKANIRQAMAMKLSSDKPSRILEFQERSSTSPPKSPAQQSKTLKKPSSSP